MAEEVLTEADIIEAIVNLNHTAKRQHGTAYWERTHAKLNDVLELWSLAHDIEARR